MSEMAYIVGAIVAVWIIFMLWFLAKKSFD